MKILVSESYKVESVDKFPFPNAISYTSSWEKEKYSEQVFPPAEYSLFSSSVTKAKTLIFWGKIVLSVAEVSRLFLGGIVYPELHRREERSWNERPR